MSLKPQNRIKGLPVLFLLLGILLMPLSLIACSEDPVASTFGITFRGRILDVTLYDKVNLPEIVYKEDDGTYSVIKPSSPLNELVVFHARVDNFGATVVQMDIDSEPPVLRTADGVSIAAVNTSNMRVESNKQHYLEYRQMLTDLGVRVPTAGLFIRSLHEVEQDFGLEGWLVFDVPKGATLKDLKWSAGGDAIRIIF